MKKALIYKQKQYKCHKYSSSEIRIFYIKVSISIKSEFIDCKNYNKSIKN